MLLSAQYSARNARDPVIVAVASIFLSVLRHGAGFSHKPRILRVYIIFIQKSGSLVAIW